MTTTRETNRFGPRWARREGCLEQHQSKSRCVPVGRSPTRPWALFLATGRLPPQPPTIPLRHSVPRDAAVVLRCLVPHTSTTHACSHRSCGVRRGKASFSFSSAQFNRGGREWSGNRSQSPEPSTYSTNLNPSPAWRRSCNATRPFLAWEMPQGINLQQQPGPGKKAGNPGVFPTRLLPSLPGLQVP